MHFYLFFFFFFFNDTATTEIYTLSLHDALPISRPPTCRDRARRVPKRPRHRRRDRKSTRLNSSHVRISYAVFCLKKKKKKTKKKNIYNNRKQQITKNSQPQHIYSMQNCMCHK